MILIQPLQENLLFVELLIKESYDKDSYVYIENTPAIIIEFIGGEPLLETKLMTDIIDSVVGIKMVKKVGDFTEEDEPIAIVYYNEKNTSYCI